MSVSLLPPRGSTHGPGSRDDAPLAVGDDHDALLCRINDRLADMLCCERHTTDIIPTLYPTRMSFVMSKKSRWRIHSMRSHHTPRERFKMAVTGRWNRSSTRLAMSCAPSPVVATPLILRSAWISDPSRATQLTRTTPHGPHPPHAAPCRATCASRALGHCNTATPSRAPRQT